jgi:hypothetical protein
VRRAAEVSDDRTAEQKAADEQLRAAIDATSRAYGNDGGVLTDFVVIAARQSWDDDGDEITYYQTLLPDGVLPIHRILGLADYVSTRYRRQVAALGDD